MTTDALLKSWVALPASHIHNRTAAGIISKLRKQAMELEVTAMLKKEPLKSVIIHQHSAKAKRYIRLAVGREILSKTGQKVYRVLLWIKHTITNKFGEIQEIWHKYHLALPLTLQPDATPA